MAAGVCMLQPLPSQPLLHGESAVETAAADYAASIAQHVQRYARSNMLGGPWSAGQHHAHHASHSHSHSHNHRQSHAVPAPRRLHQVYVQPVPLNVTDRRLRPRGRSAGKHPSSKPTAVMRHIDHLDLLEDIRSERTCVRWGNREYLHEHDIPRHVQDIDHGDFGYPEFVPEYAKEIYVYWSDLEAQRHVTADYFRVQKDITPEMRSSLVNWLVEVHQDFRLNQETLFLTVSLLDRYLQAQAVSRDKLQLVALTCLLIASKYEETCPPLVSDILFVSDNQITRRELLDMECTILKALMFQIGTPYPLNFLRRMSKSADAGPKTHTLGKYLIELALISTNMMKYRPSMIAAAALLLAHRYLLLGDWNAQLEHYSGYSEEEILPCADELADLLYDIKDSPYQATRKKYASGRFFSISTYVEHQIAYPTPPDTKRITRSCRRTTQRVLIDLT